MANAFNFNGFTKDLERGLVVFNFSLENEGKKIEFQETLRFPTENIRPNFTQEALNRSLFSLHLILGISYWKLTCPKNIQISENLLTENEAKFWNTVYTKGLGEFFYRSKIDFRGLINFSSNKTDSNPVALGMQKGNLLGIGGGKDTVVAAEKLNEKKIPFDGFIVETQKDYDLNRELAKMLSTNTLYVKRIMDPKIFLLNKEPGFYNGHIPISAIYAFIGVVSSVLYGYENIIVSNENSADSGNVSYLGEEINHQWSKSSEFEKLLNNYLASFISGDIKYFSVLRPYSELRILSEFAKMKKYHSKFSSCNRNYAIKDELGNSRWCGKCPKCAFVFIGLSAFIDETEVISIFGKNMLENEKNLDAFKMLLGAVGNKPFECVGTSEETKTAFLLAKDRGNFLDSVIMKYFSSEVYPKISNAKQLIETTLNSYHDSIQIPEEFKNII